MPPSGPFSCIAFDRRGVEVDFDPLSHCLSRPTRFFLSCAAAVDVLFLQTMKELCEYALNVWYVLSILMFLRDRRRWGIWLALLACRCGCRWRLLVSTHRLHEWIDQFDSGGGSVTDRMNSAQAHIMVFTIFAGLTHHRLGAGIRKACSSIGVYRRSSFQVWVTGPSGRHWDHPYAMRVIPASAHSSAYSYHVHLQWALHLRMDRCASPLVLLHPFP